MRACQLCGAKSWSPAKDQDRHAEVRLLECDRCGARGREDLIIDSLSAHTGTHIDHDIDAGMPFSLPPPVDYAEVAGKMLRGLIPNPETRTERLVRELICSDSFAGLSGNESDCALWLVGMARAIEHELDRCAAHSPESIPTRRQGEPYPVPR
jgi:hypothetical protein